MSLVYDDSSFITLLAFYNVSHWQLRSLLDSPGNAIHNAMHNREFIDTFFLTIYYVLFVLQCSDC